jgi:hypothetical protein
MLRGAPGIVAMAAVLAATSTARPQAPPPSPSPERQRLGVDLGVQLGFGWPYGRINDAVGPINGIMSSFVPIAVDAGYRVEDRIAVGLLFQYGVLRFRDQWDACSSTAPCRGSDASLAAHVTLHAPVSWRFVPWLRLGAGYEWLRLALPSNFLTGAPGDATFTFRGWTFGMAQLGVDYAVLPRLSLGPVVGLTVGRYNRASDTRGEMSLVYKTVHEWLMFGVRGVFHL